VLVWCGGQGDSDDQWCDVVVRLNRFGGGKTRVKTSFRIRFFNEVNRTCFESKTSEYVFDKEGYGSRFLHGQLIRRQELVEAGIVWDDILVVELELHILEVERETEVRALAPLNACTSLASDLAQYCLSEHLADVRLRVSCSSAQSSSSSSVMHKEHKSSAGAGAGAGGVEQALAQAPPPPQPQPLLHATEELPAHRVVLAARSPVFRAMFSSAFKDSEDGVVVRRAFPLLSSSLSFSLPLFFFLFFSEPLCICVCVS
jgi:hypothetical protein